MKDIFDIQFFADGEGGGNDGGEGVTTLLGGEGGDPAPEGGVTTQPTQTQPTNVMPEPTPPAQTAPEQYEPFQLPEGAQADEAQMQAASALFKELNLTQEQAQKLVDLHAKNWIGAVDAYEQELTRRVAEWGELTKKHPDFGGARLNESLTSVRRAIGKVGGEGLEKALNETGSINHPEIFAAFARMGKMFAEDGFVEGRNAPGSGGNRTPSDMARVVYPNMKHS